MTEDDRTAGRWQGNVDARLKAVEEHATGHGALLTDHAARLTRLESKQSVIWSGLAAAVLIAGGSLFKLWANGGF
jgi:hypothetical protein